MTYGIKIKIQGLLIMEVEGNNDLHPDRFTAQKFSTGVPIREKRRWISTPA
jgi:hypothetical protein